MSIDQQFIEFVIKSLVSKPDAVKVDRTIDEKGVLLELTVDPEDLGRVIGKRGATAQSIRTLLRALGTKNDARYNLKIVDNGPPKSESKDRPSYNDKPKYEDKPKTEEKKQPAAEDDVWGRDETSSKEAPVAAGVETAEEEESDAVAKTRRELADLDDLDV